MKYAIVDDTAYFVKDNLFWTAPLFNDRIDHEGAEPLDPSEMTLEEMKHLFEILDKLEEE